MRREARRGGARFLGTVPFDPDVVPEADKGRPAIVARPDSATARAWKDIAAKVRETVGP